MPQNDGIWFGYSVADQQSLQPYLVSRCVRHSSQKGSVLIVSLLILLMMTVLGIASIQTTTMQERMAGNFYDRNLAFQAAEAALREGEAILRNTPAPLDMVIPTVALPDAPGAYNWANAEPYTGVLAGNLSNPPGFFIERLLDTGDDSDITDDQGIYRVTARGQGGTAEAQVVLQTTVRRGLVGD